MTTPPADARPFEVPAPPTPPTAIERLLALAGNFTRHNDAIDALRLDAASGPDLGAHADSAQKLAHETVAAIHAVQSQRLYESTEMIEAVVRLKQLAYLSTEASGRLSDAQETLISSARDTGTESPDVPEAVGHRVQLARELTALAPEAAVDSAGRIAGEMRRRKAPSGAPADGVTPLQRTALRAVARGHVVVNSSLDRHYVHSRDTRVPISTLRSLEAKGLVERDPKSAPPAYDRGPLQDRVRLTSGGAAAVASLISQPPATATGPTATARPAPAMPAPARTR